MKISLETQLIIEGTKVMSRGNFDVNSKDFNKEPELTAAIIAYEWIQEQKKQTGYRETIIEKVILNGEHDISEVVRQIRPEIKDDLPF